MVGGAWQPWRLWGSEAGAGPTEKNLNARRLWWPTDQMTEQRKVAA